MIISLLGVAVLLFVTPRHTVPDGTVSTRCVFVVPRAATKEDDSSSDDAEVVKPSSSCAGNVTALKIERNRERGHKAFQTRLERYGKESIRELNRKANQAKVEKYGEEGIRELGRKGYQAAVNKAGGASEFARKGYQAAVNKVGGASELGRKGIQAAARKMGGTKALTLKARQARKDTNPLKGVGVGMQAGIGSARKAGKYTRYPGVYFRKDSGKWCVDFKCQGERWYCGTYSTEEEAALAHDEVVRKHKLMRPLHFPRENEISSTSSPAVQPKYVLEEAAARDAEDKLI